MPIVGVAHLQESMLSALGHGEGLDCAGASRSLHAHYHLCSYGAF